MEDYRPPLPKLIHIQTMVMTGNLVTYMRSDGTQYTRKTSQRYSKEVVGRWWIYSRSSDPPWSSRSLQARLEVALHEYLQYAYAPSWKNENVTFKDALSSAEVLAAMGYHQVIFTHDVMLPHNIIVKDGYISGIMDCEYSRSFPEHCQWIIQ